MTTALFAGRDPFSGGALQVSIRNGRVASVGPMAPLPGMP